MSHISSGEIKFIGGRITNFYKLKEKFVKMFNLEKRKNICLGFSM
jgi:hypothetical protein